LPSQGGVAGEGLFRELTDAELDLTSGGNSRRADKELIRTVQAMYDRKSPGGSGYGPGNLSFDTGNAMPA
jgi:hypothetical protein